MAVTKSILRYVLGIIFILAGANHFVSPGFYLPMMPDYLPWHSALVFLSGVAEIIAGILVIVPMTQRVGAWALIALLVAVFPANLNMALHAEQFQDYGSQTVLYIRLPLQVIPMIWAYWYTGKTSPEAPMGTGSAPRE